MSTLSEKVAFLKGLAEGLKLGDATPEQKLIGKMIETLDEMAKEVELLRNDYDDLNDYVEEIDDDLTAIEDIFDDEDDDECGCGCEHDDDDYEDDDEESSSVEYECPHCGETTHFDVADFDLEEDYKCPSCQKPLFPETEEDDEEDEDDD